jgi:cytochrome oxidase Cu insertion factor (SCO1/SenC/PrrC family)
LNKKWLNPFSVSFVLGLVFLTALPFLQRRFLKAPPPVGPLGRWELVDARTSKPLGSELLAGKVLLVTFASEPCDEACVEQTAGLSRALSHTDDLGDAIQLVTVAARGALPQLQGQPQGPRLHLLTGSPGQLEQVASGFRANWGRFAGTDGGSTTLDSLRLPAYAVVDQQGQVRGFWRTDSAGRGNAINAARLLARYGVNP